ncbi:hypothetical protein [Marinirhabdus gelatinilytica]|uniref:Uncharacterized protein n=1 Tax=Marinirhabdus gelatinilytica TaxID=1703343 RepID=A0A370Q8W3_9FLAO|nr:hypothetical protein [Marinirhabdus gelatinilytica]RDK84807.1 hypothetical protein C8D94_104180 [Marinirhabdus gelatinilytica]
MVVRLKNNEQYNLPKQVQKTLNKYAYVFNPSLVISRENHYLAIRAFCKESNSILALLFVWNDKKEVQEVNLTHYFCSRLKLVKVADPKLFVLEEEVYGTFNSGDAIKGSNSIILFQLDKSLIKNYYECIYSDRIKTEKNWAFFKEKEEMFVLYSLDPLKILKLDKVSENKIFFKNFFCDPTQRLKNHSIGTPLIRVKNGYGFIAHKKLYRKRKRLYLGKMAILKTSGPVVVSVRSIPIIHSFESLLGSKFKFNKNLISCSYFSGLYRYQNKLILGYGINDIDYNIVIVNKKKLWL